MSFLIPIAHAAIDNASFGRVVDPIINNIVTPIIEVMFAIALVVFVYGVAQLIWSSSESDSRTKGKNALVGGVIGMFIMLSAWGIVYLVANTVKSL